MNAKKGKLASLSYTTRQSVWGNANSWMDNQRIQRNIWYIKNHQAMKQVLFGKKSQHITLKGSECEIKTVNKRKRNLGKNISSRDNLYTGNKFKLTYKILHKIIDL